LLHVAEGFFDSINDEHRRGSTCANAAFRTGAAAGFMIAATHLLTIIAGVLALRVLSTIFRSGFMRHAVRRFFCRVWRLQVAMFHVAIQRGLTDHAALLPRHSGHASHREGDDEQAQEK